MRCVECAASRAITDEIEKMERDTIFCLYSNSRQLAIFEFDTCVYLKVYELERRVENFEKQKGEQIKKQKEEQIINKDTDKYKIPNVKLVVIIRDESPMYMYQDPPNYRAVSIELTEEQKEQLRLFRNKYDKNFEEISESFLEEEKDDDTTN